MPEVLDRSEVTLSSINVEAALRNAESYFTNELDLPIMQHSGLFTDALAESDTVILAAETGSGKSAAGAVIAKKALLALGLSGQVAITEQRRPAVVNLAEFVGKHVGEEYVAYQHKQRNTIKPSTQIVYTMEGTLLNQIAQDRLLRQYDCVILDEVHERTVNLDLLTPLLKEAQRKRKEQGLKPLKIVMTSATLDKEKLTSYFQEAKYVEVPGRTFPVKKTFLEENVDDGELINLASEKVIEILKDENIKGHILVFMPGKFEITKAKELIERRIKEVLGERNDLELFELMGGSEGSDNFKKILESTLRKIIIGSDVMKASLTIPGTEAVVVPGKMRISKYDKETELTNITTIDAPQDDIEQYVGRAGRTKAGFAYLLMTEEEFNERPKQLQPELLRSDLSAQLLRILDLGIDMTKFDFIDHPDPVEVLQAFGKLRRLGAVDGDGQMTDMGRAMLEYDTNPNYARMLVEARNRGCLEEVALIIGMLGQKSIFKDGEDEKYKRFIEEGSDPLTLLNVWNEYVDHNTDPEVRKKWGEENGIWTRNLYNGFGATRDILRESQKRTPDKFDLTSDKKKQITHALLAGLPDRILIKNKYGVYDVITGKKQGIRIGKQSVMSNERPELLVSADLRYVERSKKTFAGMNMVVSEEMIRMFQPDFELAKEVTKDNETKEDKKVEETQHDPIVHTETNEHEGHSQNHVSHESSHSHAEEHTHNVHSNNSHDSHSVHAHQEGKKTFMKRLRMPFEKLKEYLKKLFKRDESSSSHGSH